VALSSTPDVDTDGISRDRQPGGRRGPLRDALPPAILAGARAALPLSVAVGVAGVSFGVLAEQAGMGSVAPIVMSATTYAGSAQFAGASVLDAGGGLLAALLAAALLNTRYVPIGLSAARALHRRPLRRLAEAQLVIDESWALAYRGGGRFDRGRLLGAGGLLWVVWVLGTTLGVLGGGALGDGRALGLDAMFPALFLVLLVSQARDRRTRVAALLGGAIALAALPLAPAGVPVLAAALVVLLGLRDVSATSRHGEAAGGRDAAGERSPAPTPLHPEGSP
jgi:4-azaleucine resistance transporter AzlC